MDKNISFIDDNDNIITIKGLLACFWFNLTTDGIWLFKRTKEKCVIGNSGYGYKYSIKDPLRVKKMYWGEVIIRRDK